MNEAIIHLYVPKEFRIWCRPNHKIGSETRATILPSKATCANCLTKMRWKNTGKTAPFKVKHTGRIPA